MSYCTAPLRTTPEAKNGRSNSFVTNTSQSPKGRYPTRQAPQQRFIHPSDPTINFNIPPFPQSSKNANSKQLPPSLFESNQAAMQRDSNHRPHSRSPQIIGKENTVVSRSSYKTIVPSPPKHSHGYVDANVPWLKDRIAALERQITAFLNENKQLTKVLDQQIQINQQLKEQLRVKTQEANSLEQHQHSQADDQELHSIIDQLQIYKQIVESLEVKINNVVQENNRLNECLELSQIENDQLRQQLQSTKQKFTTFSDINESYKLKEENGMLRQNIDSMEREMQEMRNHIEMFKQHIITIKGALTPQSSCDRQTQIQLEEQHQELLRMQTENNSLRQAAHQQDNAIRYLEQIMGLDQQKLRNTEEKLSILEKENAILKSRK